MKVLLKEIISDFHTRKLPDAKKREIDIPLYSGKIITLIGPRRSGKSFLFFYLINQLLAKNIKKKQIILLNFEDERLDFQQDGLDTILQAYRELYPETDLSTCYFFFDEVQNISGWEKFIRRIYDNYTKNIFITGSNAKLLSYEIATALRGRTVSFEVLPLSFREYLAFSAIEFDDHDAQTKSRVNIAFDKYLVEGGFPELLPIEPSIKSRVLREYFDVMTYRDIIQRYAFSNLPVVKYFLKRISANCCSYISIHKAYNEIRSQGFRLDKNLLYQVYEAARNCFLCFDIKKFSYSELKEEGSERKTYFIDNGLLNVLTFKFSKNLGILLENVIYLELRRRSFEIFYFKDKVECDFVIQSNNTLLTAIQVSYNMQDPDTRTREINGLLNACKKFKIKKGIIITYLDEAAFNQDDIEIQVIPAVQFLLNKIE
ncbi:MAG TPA: ATP-binding protein [Saprospiraceae bacterium]|nr:ATP-binding protein [Saprospiraceae bacterium]